MINSILFFLIMSITVFTTFLDILIRRGSRTRTDGILGLNFDYRTATSLACPTNMVYICGVAPKELHYIISSFS